MRVKFMLEIVLFCQLLLAFAGSGVVILRKAYRVFPQVLALLIAEGVTVAATLALLYFHNSFHYSGPVAFKAYFWTAWASSAVSFVLRISIVWAVFAEAMRPMSGLRKAGKLVFRWVMVVSMLVAGSLLAGPGVFSGLTALVNTFERLQQGSCVLVTCLLVFVCFAVRPLGLTFRSHLFGVSLGLGINAVVDLIGTAWIQFSGTTSIFSPVPIFTAFGSCIALTVWLVYFAAPEPARKMILLPTTSPFFFWNRISEILGDSPGHVAVAGFSPSMLAPAEIEMLTAATSAERNAEIKAEAEKVLQFPAPEAAPLPQMTDFLPTRPSLAV